MTLTSSANDWKVSAGDGGRLKSLVEGGMGL